MSNIPFGYEMTNGELVPHPFESKVVKVMNGLMAIGLTSSEAKSILNDLKVPKRGQESGEYPIDDKIHEIYQTGSKLYFEKVLLKIESSVDDLLKDLHEKNVDIVEFHDVIQGIKNVIKLSR